MLQNNTKFWEMIDDFTWYDNIFLAYDLITTLKPSNIVELGTYMGTSFFTMVQAAVDSRLDTRLIAIDSWKGESHTGFYEEDIYINFKNKIKINFPDSNIVIKRDLFSNALKDFKDSSIDFLHIDGLHTYEAVKNDFETWLPKTTNKACIIFHDICVTEKDFGVNKLWQEIKQNNPTWFFLEYNIRYGLGIIFKDKNSYIKFLRNKSPNELVIDYSQLANDNLNFLKLISMQNKRDQIYLAYTKNKKELNRIKFEEISKLNKIIFTSSTEISRLEKLLNQLKSRKIIKLYLLFLRIINKQVF